MKSVLISIQPKWCELIASGKKTVEVRKTAPKLRTPFKCYIYETKANRRQSYYNVFHEKTVGKVIGEFVCDKIDEFKCCCVPYKKENNLGYGHFLDNGVYRIEADKIDDGIVFERYDEYIDSMLKNKDLEDMCLSVKELYNYIGLGKKGYGWHISDLKIYDKPKELGEFYCKISCDYKNTGYCRICTDDCKYRNGEFYHSVTRPPQSWCYVGEL